jgi:hypothetical protein
METSMRKLLVLSLGLVAACRGSDSKKNPDGNTGGDLISEEMHIQDVQNDALPAGSPVELHGVVVTAIDAYGAKTGDIWVQEPTGGPFSGIHVFGAPAAAVGQLQLGDIVDISSAVKDEFALTSDTSGRTVTELKAASGGMINITRQGPGTPLTPQTVDALMVGQLSAAARDAEWEKWEGVLITVTNVSALNSDACVGSACTDPTLHKFDITGVATVESSLAAMPTPTVKRGDCLASVTGVVDYFFDYLILPRTTAELAAGGSSCPPTEAGSHTICSDGIDNDGNGFGDCMDLGCEIGPGADPACSAQTSVVSVQNGTNATGAVTFNNGVFVTARKADGKTLWVADALAGAQYNGVEVFFGGGGMADAAFVPGAKISLQGLVSEFDVTVNGMQMGDKVTEITNPTGALLAAPAGLPTGLAITDVMAAGDIGTAGEPFEGVLVAISHVKVTNPALGQGKVELTDNNGHKITMDDTLFAYGTLTMNACYNLTGIMDVQLADNIRTVNPRSAADMVVTTGCN